jgi:twinkle protein
MNGKHAEMKACFDKAKTIDPVSLKGVEDYREEVLALLENEAVCPGMPLPFGPKLPFHIRWNEMTVVTGLNGSGKTQILGFLSCHNWSLGMPTCIASMEVKPVRSLKFLAQQAGGIAAPSREQGEKILDWMSGGFWMFDHVGDASLKDILEVFRYAYRRHGVRFFVIDSWMMIGIKNEDLDAQSEALTQITTFKHAHDVHVFLVCHPRKVKDASTTVGKMDIKGSGEITDKADNVWVVTRNYKKEEEIESMMKHDGDEEKLKAKRRSTFDAILKVEKQKNGEGDQPSYEIWFEKSTKQYFGYYRANPKSFIKSTPDEQDPVAEEITEQLDHDAPF